jgi:hypothetical protein
MTTLELHRRVLPAEEHSGEIWFLDFMIDGHSLFETLGNPNLVSCLAWFPVIEAVVKDADRLVLRAPADLPNNRRSLYICAACGDVGCGAMTVLITEHDDEIIWHDFGYENGWDGREPDLTSFEGIGPFTFQKVQYIRKIEEGIQRLRLGD